ncbi:ArsI/CadI family heavy metal resistance metalloenzyme [Paraburkholderia dilworthii]|uniref:ArsI/CadI family heavy metal resistance metalloenzyme n=1 Tax=Paraburkholderia dilworthii TaxID=948106 RepID=UPI0004250088|nr:ArsI/CadI family heavy metal resistance metalloenzyme [Paraburkholderia dilworthii]
MKRMHIHIAVEDLQASTRFYTSVFGGAEPTVSKHDYRKWELSDPKVNFAISQRGVQPGIDHLGIQVETDEELAEMRERFASAESQVIDQTATTCCYAKSNKSWAVDPQGVAWETFRTVEAAPTYGQSRQGGALDSDACCARAPATSALRDHT